LGEKEAAELAQASDFYTEMWRASTRSATGSQPDFRTWRAFLTMFALEG
jgi:hypothetical protein